MMFVDGVKTVSGADTPTRLVPAGSQPSNRITNITVQAPKENGSPVAIGGSTVVSNPIASATGVLLYPGESESFTCADAADVWFSSHTGTDKLRWHAKAL